MRKTFLTISCLLIMLTIGFTQSSAPALDSEVAVDTGNGYGSTGLYARRFTNVDVNVGTAITYADSASDGATFTINQDGVYAISMTELTVGDTGSISLNASASTTLNSLSANQRLCTTAMQNGIIASCSVTLGLSSGDVIREHRSTGGNCSCLDSSSYVRFIITRVR